MVNDKVHQLLFSTIMIIFVLSFAPQQQQLQQAGENTPLVHHQIIQVLTYPTSAICTISSGLYLWIYSVNYTCCMRLKGLGLGFSSFLFYISSFRVDFMIILQNLASILTLLEDENDSCRILYPLLQNEIGAPNYSTDSESGTESPLALYMNTNKAVDDVDRTINSYYQDDKKGAQLAGEKMFLDFNTINDFFADVHVRPGMKKFNYCNRS